jgi:dipeptidyl aminopeptidase/acylaminoacyl peptidase
MVVQNAQRVASVRVRPTATALAETSDATKYFLPDDPDDLLKADPARRSPVSFRSGDLTLAGHLYRPPHAGDSERTPAVALCGPISSVKEQTLPHYANRLAEAGYTALTFDPRAIDFPYERPRASALQMSHLRVALRHRDDGKQAERSDKELTFSGT